MRLLHLLLLIGASLLLATCQSSGVGQVLRNGLPAFARVVVLETELEDQELSRRILARLERAGNQCSGSTLIRTEPRRAGSLWVRTTVEIKGPVASASSEWAWPTEGPSDDGELFWRVARNAEGSAEEVFLELCRMMEEVPHVAVSYRFD